MICALDAVKRTVLTTFIGVTHRCQEHAARYPIEPDCTPVTHKQAVEELGAVSVNELHDFVTARWRRSVPPASQADVVKALHLNVRQVVRRLVEEAQMEVRLIQQEVPFTCHIEAVTADPEGGITLTLRPPGTSFHGMSPAVWRLRSCDAVLAHTTPCLYDGRLEDTIGFIDLADQRRVSSCEIAMPSGSLCTSIPSPSHRQHRSLDTSWAMHTGGAGAGVQGRPAGAAVPAGRRRDGAHGPRRAAEHPAPHGRLRCYAPPRGAEVVGGSSQSCTAVLLVSVLRLRPNGARHVEISQCAGRSASYEATYMLASHPRGHKSVSAWPCHAAMCRMLYTQSTSTPFHRLRAINMLSPSRRDFQRASSQSRRGCRPTW